MDRFVVHVIDPDQAIAEGLATLLNTYGIRVISYPDAETFLACWPPVVKSPCCLMIETDLPGLSGPALLQQLRNECGDLHVILLVSVSSPALVEIAKSTSQVSVVEKPFINGTLIESVLRLQQAA